jgi:hypothetical protein
VDREALVRAVRRRQALDALAFERDRAVLLVEQIEETVASIDGSEVDAAIYAHLSSDDVRLVRAALRDVDDEGATDGESLADSEDVDASREHEEDEEEIGRLQGELALSEHVQAALERYLDLLGPPSHELDLVNSELDVRGGA